MLALWMYFFDEQTWLENPAPPPQIIFGGAPRDRLFSYSEKKLIGCSSEVVSRNKARTGADPNYCRRGTMQRPPGSCHAIGHVVDVDLEMLSLIIAVA